jgi:hypothetical protein
MPDISSMVHAHLVGSLSDGWLTVCEPAPGGCDNVLELPSRGYATG